MSATQFTATLPNGEVAKRSSQTKDYRFVVVVTDAPTNPNYRPNPGVIRWSETEAAANAYAKTLRGERYTGHYADVQVLPVDAAQEAPAAPVQEEEAQADATEAPPTLREVKAQQAAAKKADKAAKLAAQKAEKEAAAAAKEEEKKLPRHWAVAPDGELAMEASITLLNTGKWSLAVPASKRKGHGNTPTYRVAIKENIEPDFLQRRGWAPVTEWVQVSETKRTCLVRESAEGPTMEKEAAARKAAAAAKRAAADAEKKAAAAQRAKDAAAKKAAAKAKADADAKALAKKQAAAKKAAAAAAKKAPAKEAPAADKKAAAADLGAKIVAAVKANNPGD